MEDPAKLHQTTLRGCQNVCTVMHQKMWIMQGHTWVCAGVVWAWCGRGVGMVWDIQQLNMHYELLAVEHNIYVRLCYPWGLCPSSCRCHVWRTPQPRTNPRDLYASVLEVWAKGVCVWEGGGCMCTVGRYIVCV